MTINRPWSSNRTRALRRTALGTAGVLLSLATMGSMEAVTAAPTVVLNEDWSACTVTPGATLYPDALSKPQESGGTPAIPIKIYMADPNPGVTCPDWTATANTQVWLAVVYDGLTASAQATSQRGIYLNEGNSGLTPPMGPGQIKRTLSGLRPGAFYEIIVEAWRDAAVDDTYLMVKVESGSYTNNLPPLTFSKTTNGVQTIRGQFDVGASSAVVTLTAGTQTYASPIVKSVVIRSVVDDNPAVTSPVAATPKWTLSYDANGGSCTAPVQTEFDNTWVRTYDANSCSRSGYAFTGWNTSKDGTGLQFSPGAPTKITGDNTLFAQWSTVNVTATNDTAIAVKGRPVTGSLTLNDTFPAGSTFTVVSGTTRGTIVVNPDGTFTYTPTQAPRATTRSRG